MTARVNPIFEPSLLSENNVVVGGWKSNNSSCGPKLLSQTNISSKLTSLDLVSESLKQVTSISQRAIDEIRDPPPSDSYKLSEEAVKYNTKSSIQDQHRVKRIFSSFKDIHKRVTTRKGKNDEYIDMSFPQPHHPSSSTNGTAPGQPPQGSGDSYFTESKKGEVNELRQLLRGFSMEKDMTKKRDIIKKVIAYMTLGIDVSRLFTEMMLAIETRDLVVKKMVYLFLCNYATTHPDLAQMCTNTLQKDCSNEDPMVRGLALRALCSLRLPQMVEYISEPLRKSLTDSHAYVRKTGVMGILKLFHLDKEAFESCNFVDILYDMLRDPDANVVSNCIWVLNEVMAKGPDGGMAINRAIMLALLNRIHEFSEFGILPILELVPRYRPVNEEEVFQIMNLLDPVLTTSNAAASVATIRAFLSLASHTQNAEMSTQVIMRVKAPLVTLVTSASPELAFCLLKHVDALIDLAPGAFNDEYRQFFVRYNELTHIKYLKVQILSKLVNPYNAKEIVAELSEYVGDIDTTLSRLAVRAISRIACHGVGGEGCEQVIVQKLVEMLDLDVGHVPSEAATALADVLRKNPNLKESVAHRLPRALRYITEPSGRASVIWLLGETGVNVKEAPYALEKLITNYDEITAATVKMALLTSTMKLFFARPPECKKMLGELLNKATEDVSNQDLHDRALLYHRLLKSNPTLAKAVVSGTSSTIPLNKPFAEEDDETMRKSLTQEFNTLSTIYLKTSDNFIAEEFQTKLVVMPETVEQPEPLQAPPSAAADTYQQVQSLTPAPLIPEALVKGAPVADLLDFGGGTPPPVPTPMATSIETNVTLNLSQSVSMTGDTYQSLWGANNEAASLVVPFKTLPSSTAEVEKLLLDARIFTMASGELPNEYKLFLYCQDESNYILIQATMKKSPTEFVLTLKTTSTEETAKAKVDLVVETMKQALSMYF